MKTVQWLLHVIEAKNISSRLSHPVMSWDLPVGGNLAHSRVDLMGGGQDFSSRDSVNQNVGA